MKKIILLIFMLFFHVIDDFYLQGILASMKQRKWWEDNAPSRLYRYDYIAALIIHAFSWTVMIHIPLFVYYRLAGPTILPGPILVFFVGMTAMHAYIDNEKANNHTINLIVDQTLHVIQILFLWSMYVVVSW